MDLIKACGHGQLLDYTTGECINICPEDFWLRGGECVEATSTCQAALNIKEYTKLTKNTNTSQIQLHHKTFLILQEDDMSQCYNCEQITTATIDDSDFLIDSHGGVRYKNNMIPQSLVYRIDDVSSYVCLDSVITTNVTRTSFKGENVVTYILLSLSIASIICYFVAYHFLARLRNIPGKIVAANMFSLLMAYIFFLLRNINNLEKSKNICTAIAIIINYFFLASFVFNIVYAGFIVRSLEFIDIESQVNKWTARRLWLVGLLAPLLVILPGIILDQVTKSDFRPEYGGEQCFIAGKFGTQIYFIIPIGVCLLVAIVLYFVITFKLVSVAKQTRQVRSNHSEKIVVAVKLLIVLGFNWIFAIVAAIDRQPITILLFIITCTLQGFLSFVVFICNKATLDDIKKWLRKKMPREIELGNSTSSKSMKSNATATTFVKKTLHHKDSANSLLKTGDDASL